MLANEMMRPTFWLAALQIMGINILLSGDNAVVIALAVRELPPRERFWGMVLGAGCAAVLLILFTGIVATLKLTPAWTAVAGMTLGSDVFVDPADRPTFIGNIKWAPPSGRESSGRAGAGNAPPAGKGAARNTALV